MHLLLTAWTTACWTVGGTTTWARTARTTCLMCLCLGTGRTTACCSMSLRLCSGTGWAAACCSMSTTTTITRTGLTVSIHGSSQSWGGWCSMSSECCIGGLFDCWGKCRRFLRIKENAEAEKRDDCGNRFREHFCFFSSDYLIECNNFGRILWLPNIKMWLLGSLLIHRHIFEQLPYPII